MIAILGPTASGKSALAVAVARRLRGEVVNGDPFQALQGLEIGTGQPSEEERKGVSHVGYGVLPLSARPNPAAFGALVRGWLAGARSPVLVTGSGLYLRGIWDQLSDLPAVPEATVAKVRDLDRRLGTPVLHRYLRAADPDRGAALHPNDSARVQRALALHLATGRRPSELREGRAAGPPEGWRVLVVAPARDARRERVARRVAAQMAAGWPAEVERIRRAGSEGDLRALSPLGYEALLDEGPRAAGRIIQETQAYAKRQATWFRHQLATAPTWDPDAEPLEAALLKLGLP
ncbi:MAG TPA: tRNA (adenosine(37)-N6)-dimethylallyltransferase MiaA [Holophagaceae bacterium]|jgi:tRNA dimethylallyltransferase|nr:tRNA (adenosine(37)-N6)-dimethylallyltransferase MiaA [Holophagaceae bacterium]